MSVPLSAAIIGAGPAGIAAAIHLQRAGVDYCLFEGDEPGGLLRNANLVENYPGFPGGITGLELAQRMWQQAQALGVNFVRQDVSDLDYDAPLFHFRAGAENVFARLVLVAAGTRAIPLPAVSLPAELQPRLLYEILPILHLSGLTIAIIGAGDLAFDYALNLGRRNRVLILNRSDQPRCLGLLRQRASACPQIDYHPHTTLQKVEPGEKRPLTLTLRSPAGDWRFECDYLVGAIGRQPRLDCLAPRLLERRQELEQAGLLYFAGDVRKGWLRQAAIAAGDGLQAAMLIQAALKNLSEPAARENY